MTREHDESAPSSPELRLPRPDRGSRWRWSNSRRAMVGGGVLAAVLSLGGAAAGASTMHTGGHAPPSGGRPSGHQGQPTAAGKVTALGTDAITVAGRGTAAETITYTGTTTFRSPSGTTLSATSLKVGDFVTAQGTKAGDGGVTATSVTISTLAPPGPGRGPGGRPGGAPPAGSGTGGPGAPA